MKTVKEIFSKAFGEVPEEATCHVAILWEDPDSSGRHCVICIGGDEHAFYDDGWLRDELYMAVGPDISDRPASAFRGFFGAEYDAALDAEKESRQLSAQIACWKIGKCNTCGDSIKGPNGENFSTCPNCNAQQPEGETI